MNNSLETISKIRSALNEHVIGQEYIVERLLVALLADGHVLLEGVPGLAKTRLLAGLTNLIGCEMARIQFTPDLLPSDLIGTEVYQPQSGEFSIRQGPLFANMVLADEINRAPAKVQSALLQAMQEREVTIGEETFKLPLPFFVLATQNPIEQEGTYQLPEAQLDRFLMKLVVDYPNFDKELEMLSLVTAERTEPAELKPIVDISEILNIRRDLNSIHVDPKIDRYIVSLVQATRKADDLDLKGLVEWGASPRASIALMICSQALAFIREREFVTPDDVKDIAPDVLRHRVLTSFEAEARDIDSDEVIRVLLRTVTVP